MKKITLISGKDSLPIGALDFACQLNRQERILLNGVFLPAFNFWDSMLYYPYGMTVPAPYYPPTVETVNAEAISAFRQQCSLSKVEYAVHEKTYEDVTAELRMESRFSDLLLCSAESLRQQLEEGIAADYYKHTVRKTECPVIVFPEKPQEPQQVILAYDGSAASVFAIRQFTLLLPHLTSLPTHLVFVEPDPGENIPEKARIEELAARHFPNLSISKLEIASREYFVTWLSEMPGAILVAGAAGRGGFAEFFRKSFVQDMISEQLLPVFVAHY